MPPTPPNQAEEWRPVVGYEGVYEVSDHGNVRSLRIGKVLRPAPGGAGKHLTVSLSRHGKQKTHYVHKMVLEAFVGPCPDGQEGCHGPNGRLDNSRWNLYYGTHQQNSGLDRLRDGTHNRGDRGGGAKLTWDQVAEIRKRYHEDREFQRVIAADFGVDQSVISDIVTGKSWVLEGV